MGVKDFNKLLQHYLRDTDAIRPLDSLRGYTIYIDASIFIHQWVAVGDRRAITNGRGTPINHLQGCFFRTAALIADGARPVYVFDGPKIPIKRERPGRRIARNVYGEIQQLLDHMRVPWLRAPGESEAQCAHLGIVGGEDMDSIIFGASLLRGLTLARPTMLYDRAKILRYLRITGEQLVDVAILLGNDYNSPQVGYKRAYELIRQHGNIENLIERGLIKDFEYRAAREAFLRPLVSAWKPKKMRAFVAQDLYDFLIAHGLEHNRIIKTLVEYKP